MARRKPKKSTPRPTRIILKLKKSGLNSLSPHECCRLVSWQLERVHAWESLIYDKIWGSGGGGTPPPPPAWPPA